MSSIKQNKEVVRRFNKEFIENKDMTVFDECMSPHFINHMAAPGVSKGPDGVLYFFEQFLRPAFPDIKVEIYDLTGEADKVVTRKAFVTIHKGEFLGLKPSNKKVVINIIDIL